MSERKFKFSKLIRDGVVGSIISNGNKPSWRILSESEFIEELKNKIVEEATEVSRTKDPKEVIKELADVQELIDNLRETLGVSKSEFSEIQMRKNEKSGSFKKKHFIDSVITTDDDSEWVKYFLANPDKYPEE